MADKPILFSSPMVRALLAGTKTQTRRALKPQPYDFVTDGKHYWNASGHVGGRICISDRQLLDLHRKARPGDRLWVREGWQTGMSGSGPQISYRATPDYCAIDAWDGPDEGAGPSFNYDRCPGATWHHWLGDVLENDGPWRPSIHMPRWASRLTLTVTDVRVERLQDISEPDALAEGIVHPWNKRYPFGLQLDGDAYCLGHTAAQAYRALWNTINGPGAWDANPFVAAYSFTVQRGNIDVPA